MWSHSGKELFYRGSANWLVAVEVASGLTPGAAFRVVTERVLFSTVAYLSDNRNRMYAVAPGDRSFYFLKKGNADSGAKNQLVLVVNWLDELTRKVGR
jgi:hypothetical protein